MTSVAEVPETRTPPSRAMPGPTPTSSAPVLEVPRVRFRNPHLPHPIPKSRLAFRYDQSG